MQVPVTHWKCKMSRSQSGTQMLPSFLWFQSLLRANLLWLRPRFGATRGSRHEEWRQFEDQKVILSQLWKHEIALVCLGKAKLSLFDLWSSFSCFMSSSWNNQGQFPKSRGREKSQEKPHPFTSNILRMWTRVRSCPLEICLSFEFYDLLRAYT